jgi:hypothetical protein
MSGQRVSRVRLERLSTELTGRDWAIVEMLGRVHLATGSQIGRVHWPDASPAAERAARRTLKRLTDWRVLARLERRMGGLGRGSVSWTYALDVAGQRLAGRLDGARRPHLPRPSMWAHAVTVSEVYTRLSEALRQSPAFLGAWQGEPQSWRRYAGQYGEPQIIKPDAAVRIDGQDYADLFFLEIDTGSQSRTVVARKLAAYRAYAATGAEQAAEGVFPKVMLLTTTAERHAVLVDVLGGQPPESWPLFAAGTVDDTGRLLLLPEVTP